MEGLGGYRLTHSGQTVGLKGRKKSGKDRGRLKQRGTGGSLEGNRGTGGENFERCYVFERRKRRRETRIKKPLAKTRNMGENKKFILIG